MEHITVVFDDIERVTASNDPNADMIISMICRLYIGGKEHRIHDFANEAHERGYSVSLYPGAVSDTLILKGNSLDGIRVPI